MSLFPPQPLRNACPLQAFGRVPGKGPRVAVGQPVTRAPHKKKMPFAIKANKQRSRRCSRRFLFIFAGYFLAIAFFNRRRTRTLQMAKYSLDLPPKHSDARSVAAPATSRSPWSHV